MAWQIAAILFIAIFALVWFFQDERLRREHARLAEEARYFAAAPRFRHAVKPVAVPVQPAKPTSRLRNDEAFFDNFLKQRLKR